ncbi:MAG: MFS transporter, partial [Bradyrhizobium sp.]
MTTIRPDQFPIAVQNDGTKQAATSSTGRIPRLRWGIGLLLGAGVLINYFDRINLSVAAPQLKLEFGLTDGELGWLFSGFFWSYALLQIPTGMILDRFGVTTVNRVSTFFWSLISAVTAFLSGFGSIFGARILLGAAEAPGFPASAKATGYWFPRQERALATSIFDAAAKFSNVIGVPLIALVIVHFGWRWGFGITGVLSFLYFLAFLFIYRDPSKHPRLS